MPSFAVVALCLAAVSQPWSEVRFGEKTLLLHPKCRPAPDLPLGPFVKLGDGSVLAADRTGVLASSDEGRSWQARRLFADPKKYECRPERAMLRARDGTILLAFLNQKEMAFRWDQAKGGPQPGCRLPVYVVRSTDEGRTWLAPQRIQDDYCGALRTMIQLRSGRIVLGSQKAAAEPGRHVSFTWLSDDEGVTWKRSNILDLGEYGGYGDHGGGIEPTFAELGGGRLWMLLRTERGRFSEAFSNDGGLTWEDVRPSKIAASGSPGQLQRLQSGRLVLLWNRFIDAEKRTGRREQISLAFSEDDGKTWTDPVVLAYDAKKPGGRASQHRLSYPYVLEHVPGELWVTTMQGPLRIKLLEDDFFPRRRSDKTYRVRWLPEARVKLDGRADEPAWSQAQLEKDFSFPWKDKPAPATEFRAVCDGEHLYFAFRVHDEDVVVLDRLRDEEDAVFEDRVELYFSPDERMKDYYCAEIDPRGRAFDYRGAYYRRIDPKWSWQGLRAAGAAIEQGYVVEGRIPLASFEAMGFPRLKPGVKIRCGLFRAEFHHDCSGKPAPKPDSIHTRGRQLDGPLPVQTWIAWVDPGTEEPDFHVPTSLGWLEVVKE